MARVVDAWERLEELWRARVVDYSFADQWQFVRGLIRPPRGAADRDEATSAPDAKTARRPTRALVTSLGVALLVWWLWRRWSARVAQHASRKISRPSAAASAQSDTRWPRRWSAPCGATWRPASPTAR